MPYDVKLPDIGEGIAEGEIVRWMVRPGDAVREDQPLVEVMTDKATVEIPSPRTGTVAALHAEAGALVPVGTVIVSIAVAEGAGASAPPAAGHASAAARPAPGASIPAAAAPAARAQATPAVRVLAQSLGVALEGIAGSGPGGAVTADDVRRAAGAAGAPAAASATPAAAPSAADDAEERVPLRGLRRRIAEHMRHAMEVTAPFTFVAEADFTELAAHREAVRARAAAAGIRLTYLAYVLRALPAALRRHPLLNASLDDARGEIVIKRSIHLGVATMTDEGLTVPVVRHADRLGLFALAREIQRLAEGARARRLELAELQGGTFTVTSTGARGGLLATPILHHPQVAILGVHEVRAKPAVVDGAIVPRDLTNLSLTLDHRVVDGAVGADFLYALIEALERPGAWLTEADLR
jgi:pyruvate dehydrogenase E2 component (dihydrolipoamide acetyltransferase)